MAQANTINPANLRPESRLRLQQALERRLDENDTFSHRRNHKILEKIRRIEDSPNSIYLGLILAALFIDLLDFAVFAIKLIPVVGTVAGMAVSFLISGLFALTSFFYYHIQDKYEEVDVGNLSIFFRITIISFTLFIEGIVPFFNVFPITAIAAYVVYRHVRKLREQEIEALKEKLVA